MSNKKKIIIICTMVVMLVAAAYLNVLLARKGSSDKDNNSNTLNTGAVTVFSAMKTDRDRIRAQSFTYLDSILNSETATAEAKAMAEKEKLNLIKYADSELVCENLIKARGFEDACVTMTTENINVVVMDSDLTAADVAQILGIITAETGCKATNVIIVPYSAVS